MDSKPVDRTENIDYYLTHPFKVHRHRASPRINEFDRQVMRNCERIRKEKNMKTDEVLPMYNERYYTLLRDADRKIYNTTIFLLAEGLGVSIDDLVEGCE